MTAWICARWAALPAWARVVAVVLAVVAAIGVAHRASDLVAWALGAAAAGGLATLARARTRRAQGAATEAHAAAGVAERAALAADRRRRNRAALRQAQVDAIDRSLDDTEARAREATADRMRREVGTDGE